MPSNEHIEPIAAVALAAVGGVLLIALDGWAAKAAGLLAAAGLVALVLRAHRRLTIVEEERNRLEERLLEAGDRDPLTGAFRRKRLDEELRRELALAQRTRSRVAVVAIELGGFEPAVDAYGRATGDELVLAAAEVLDEELRATDFISRPRPESFIVLLPDSDEDSARIVGGKLIRALRGVKRPKPDGGLIDLRASIGLVLSDPESASGPTELLADVERALAAAKRQGGDRLALGESAGLHSEPSRT